GDPKGVMLTHQNLRFGARASADLRQMVPGDVVYGVLPMTHVFGLVSVLMAAVSAGAKVRQESRFSAAKLHAATHEDVTILPAVPQMHALVMQYSREGGMAKLASPTLRYVSSGGAPLDPAWKRKAEGFYELPLQNGFGMTETCSGASATSNALGSLDTSVGPVTPGTECKIDDQAPGGNGAGEGEVLVRGPHVMKGYYRNPTETDKAIDAEGWLHTGDLASMDEDGCVFIVDRKKDMILTAGFNIYPAELERVIAGHPSVALVAVGSVPDEAKGELAKAYVVLKDGAKPDADAITEYCREHLAAYKVPRAVQFVADLPKTSTGKVMRRQLHTLDD
ncbi:hypothetical protein LCGC14_2880780, partial [marine sediment metagenome]